jgi:hypothetical protein
MVLVRTGAMKSGIQPFKKFVNMIPARSKERYQYDSFYPAKRYRTKKRKVFQDGTGYL